jgi:hypothetical protein
VRASTRSWRASGCFSDGSRRRRCALGHSERRVRHDYREYRRGSRNAFILGSGTRVGRYVPGYAASTAGPPSGRKRAGCLGTRFLRHAGDHFDRYGKGRTRATTPGYATQGHRQIEAALLPQSGEIMQCRVKTTGVVGRVALDRTGGTLPVLQRLDR